MAIFNRNRRAGAPIADLLLQRQDMIEQTATAHRDQWGLGSAEGWGIDLNNGTITWTFPTKTATAPVQVLGTHAAARDEWTWAWSINAVPEALKSDAETAKNFGEANGAVMLTTPRLNVNESGASDLATIAFRLSGATGFYRGPGVSTTYYTFGPVTVTHADGSANTLDIQISQ